MSSINKESKEYTQNLEEKIVELSLKLKQKNSQLKEVSNGYQMVIGKLIHNLKNPIGIIASFSEMMLEDLDNYTPEKLVRFLNAINNSAKFSLDVLNTIGKYTQVISPEFALNIEKVNFIKLLEDVVDELAEDAHNKKITFKKEYYTEKLFLNIDSLEMKIALYNVLHNAIRYSSENSTITIFLKENKDIIELIFKDEGMGISEANLPLIFEPFIVENTYDNEKVKCIGLGLTITKKIIEKHNGNVVLNSTLNKGSEFKIVLKK